jgi:hypothetical protein
MWPTALVVISCTWMAMAEQKMAVEVGVLVCSLFESGPAKTEAGVEAQEHDILCSFKLSTGAEEMYPARFLRETTHPPVRLLLTRLWTLSFCTVWGT